MQSREVLGTQDEAFRNLFARTDQPALAPWRLALVTVLQFAEGLTDRQAADGVRGRLDWKYLLGLALTDAGFDHSVLSEFRARLVAGGGEAYRLEALLKGCQARGWLKARGRQRTDSTHILAAIHVLHRVERVGQALQHTLNELAQIAPGWLNSRVPVDWFERYGRQVADYRLPKTEAERVPVAEPIGRDGQRLLAWIDEATTLAEVQTCPAMDILRQVWAPQYELKGEQALVWRPNGTLLPSAQRISSPHDPQARYSAQRGLEWVGYRLHLTEWCEATLPPLISHVETTPAPVQDLNVLDDIHRALDKRDLLPSQHLVDTGYVSAARLSNSQQAYAVDVVGPVRADVSWQARIDWDHFQGSCPPGKVSQYWAFKTGSDDNPVIEVNFRPQDCLPCPARALGTHSQNAPRVLALLPKEWFLPLQAARQRQTTAEFKAIYAKRAGIEGTLSQAVITLDLRHARYSGLAKTHLQAIATAVAVNFKRLVACLNGEPFAPTRRSPFAALAPSP